MRVRVRMSLCVRVRGVCVCVCSRSLGLWRAGPLYRLLRTQPEAAEEVCAHYYYYPVLQWFCALMYLYLMVITL